MWGQALGEAGRVLGIGLGQACQGQSGSFDSYTYGSYIPITASTTTNNTFYIDNTDMEAAKIKVEEPPDEFTQLSNHKFHELLDRFNKLT